MNTVRANIGKIDASQPASLMFNVVPNFTTRGRHSQFLEQHNAAIQHSQNNNAILFTSFYKLAKIDLFPFMN